MKHAIFRRFIMLIPALFLITVAAFLFVRLTPSDPAEIISRTDGVPPTPEALEAVREKLGLNLPIHLQYINWIKQAAHLDFGKSYGSHLLVKDLIGRAFVKTLILSASSSVLVIILSLGLGYLCARYAERAADVGIRSVLFLLHPIPNYLIAFMLLIIFSVHLKWLPSSGTGSIKHMVLPVATMTLSALNTYVRLLRNKMITQSKTSSVMYARSCGLKEKTIRHRVFRSSLISVITAFGMSLPKTMAGSFIIENIFGWPGLGRLGVAAIADRDYPLLQAFTLIMGLIFLISNFIVDLIELALKPKLRYEL